jgi:4-nitrophenyl phosphatase
MDMDELAFDSASRAGQSAQPTDGLTAHSSLSQLRGLILDMDGVLMRGRVPLPGVTELFTTLRNREVSVVIASNNSTPTVEQLLERVNAAGAGATPSEILTSSQATADYLQTRLPAGGRVYVIGEQGLTDALAGAGYVIAEDHQRVEAVVVGMCRSLTWEMLVQATLAIRAGARFIGTNPDRTFPSEIGIIPGAGSILAALEAASATVPVIIGKPEPHLFLTALSRLGTRPGETAVVGDRLETDILGGRNAGLTTILVLTGVTNRNDLSHAAILPDWTFDDLDALRRALESPSR